MSRGSRWAIGIVAATTAACMIALASQLQMPRSVYGFVAFCIAIATLCFAPFTRPVTARLIGAGLLLFSVAYLADELRSHAGDTGATSVWKAIKALLLFGAPGAYLLVKGKYPSWGELANTFAGKPPSHKDSVAEQSDSHGGAEE